VVGLLPGITARTSELLPQQLLRLLRISKQAREVSVSVGRAGNSSVEALAPTTNAVREKEDGDARYGSRFESPVA
jgi:hypothetical protein